MGALRDRTEVDLRLRGLSENTRRLYLRCARDFAAYCGRSPAVVGTEEVRAFLRHLVDTRRAPSTCGVYAAALRFLYDTTLDRPAVAARIPRRRVPERLPTILSTAEVERLLAAAHSPKHRAILMTAYRPARRPARHRHLPHPRARRTSRRVRHLRPHPLPYGAPVYAPP